MSVNIKTVKCYVCRTKILPQGNSIYHFCSNDCRIQFAQSEYGKKAISKAIEKDKAKRDRELKESLTDYKKLLQSKINQIARQIDLGLSCLATGKKTGQTTGGHIFSVGSNQTMRFNLHNIHRQSGQSNHYQADDGLMRENLALEYGQDYYNFVSELRKTPTLKYKNKDFQEFYKKACELSNKFKKENKSFDLEERILMRNWVNTQLGIYHEEYCLFIRK